MSVLKNKRKQSQFEVFHHLNKLRRDITDLLLRDFGYSFEKAEARLLKQFGGRTLEQLSETERERYEKTKLRLEAFDDWFIYDQRQVIVNCLRDITKEVYIANNIYPTVMEELVQRRLHQEEAIGHCYRLVQELQYAIETLPVNVNIFLQFGEGWRKVDNKFKRAISDSAANFANVNNNGNANYNNASNANGVRPDFEDAGKP